MWDHLECVNDPGRQHGVVTIAHDENLVTLPVEVAFDIAAELLVFLMDEDDARSGNGLTLREFLRSEDEMELRRILSRITGPARPTYTNPS